MSWTSKECDFEKLVSLLEEELDANKEIIPDDRLEDVRHYLSHDELSMAFEYLYLEIMERDGSKRILNDDQVREVALFFGLNNEEECMVDPDFWSKLNAFLSRKNK